MRNWKTVGLAMALAVGLAGGAARADGPPAGLRPQGVVGPGLYVNDLDAQKAWYMDKLGMILAKTMSRDGKPFEYVMGFSAAPDAPVIVLAKSATRPAGPNAYARVIVQVPDARGLSAWMAKAGVPSREVVPGVAYFETDPEGNSIELYTPPKP